MSYQNDVTRNMKFCFQQHTLTEKVLRELKTCTVF